MADYCLASRRSECCCSYPPLNKAYTPRPYYSCMCVVQLQSFQFFWYVLVTTLFGPSVTFRSLVTLSYMSMISISLSKFLTHIALKEFAMDAYMTDYEIRSQCIALNRYYFKHKCQSDEDCAVCLGGLFNRSVLYTPCGHCFHNKCIRRWLTKHDTCPMCRSTIDPKSKEVLVVDIDDTLLELLLSWLTQYDDASDQS